MVALHRRHPVAAWPTRPARRRTTDRGPTGTSPRRGLDEAQLAWTLQSLGEKRAALEHGERALVAAGTCRKPFLRAMALVMNAELHRHRDEPVQAATLSRQVIEIADRQGYAHWHGFALVTLGWSQARHGETTEGLATIERGIALSRASGERLVMPVKLGMLADVQWRHKRIDLATATLNRAFELATQMRAHHCLGELSRVRDRIDGSGSAASLRTGEHDIAAARPNGHEPIDRRNLTNRPRAIWADSHAVLAQQFS